MSSTFTSCNIKAIKTLMHQYISYNIYYSEMGHSASNIFNAGLLLVTVFFYRVVLLIWTLIWILLPTLNLTLSTPPPLTNAGLSLVTAFLQSGITHSLTLTLVNTPSHKIGVSHLKSIYLEWNKYIWWRTKECLISFNTGVENGRISHVMTSVHHSSSCTYFVSYSLYWALLFWSSSSSSLGW